MTMKEHLPHCRSINIFPKAESSLTTILPSDLDQFQTISLILAEIQRLRRVNPCHQEVVDSPRYEYLST